MIFQETDLMETVIDPMLLIFFCIATAIFMLSSYKKPELRMFSVVLICMTIALVFCMLTIEIVEASFVVIASGVSVISTLMLRTKSKSVEGQ